MGTAAPRSGDHFGRRARVATARRGCRPCCRGIALDHVCGSRRAGRLLQCARGQSDRWSRAGSNCIGPLDLSRPAAFRLVRRGARARARAASQTYWQTDLSRSTQTIRGQKRPCERAPRGRLITACWCTPCGSVWLSFAARRGSAGFPPRRTWPTSHRGQLARARAAPARAAPVRPPGRNTIFSSE